MNYGAYQMGTGGNGMIPGAPGHHAYNNSGAPSSSGSASYPLIGRCVRKVFAPYGTFDGVVVSYDSGGDLSSGGLSPRPPLGYLVRYSDGDHEHLTEESVRQILLPHNPNAHHSIATPVGQCKL